MEYKQMAQDGLSAGRTFTAGGPDSVPSLLGWPRALYCSIGSLPPASSRSSVHRCALILGPLTQCNTKPPVCSAKGDIRCSVIRLGPPAAALNFSAGEGGGCLVEGLAAEDPESRFGTNLRITDWLACEKGKKWCYICCIYVVVCTLYLDGRADGVEPGRFKADGRKCGC